MLSVMTASVMTVMAVPAKPTPFKFTQPDGTAVMLQLKGDERSHVMTTTEGYLVTRDANGYYCFAELDGQGVLKPTSVRASIVSELSVSERAKVAHINTADVPKALSARNSGRFKAPARISGYSGIGLMDDAFLGYTELKGLVVIAQFSDVKFSETCDKAFFTRMLNEKGFSEYGGTGSARDYFIDSSNGAFVPEFDVYGPVTLPETMAYYGGNDASGDDLHPAEMIRDACKGLDGEINFKDYDIDGDGYVDNVFVFYAGYGEASYGSDDTVWPHQWELSSAGLSLTLDGVRINKYACSNELEEDYYGRAVPDGIGTFVHEFSHVLGLPDLYATDSSGSWTPGPWSVMDQGSYNNDSRTPPAYSAYERNALGWCEPVVIDGPVSATLEAINETNEAYIIPTSKQNEFFLIENRQHTGWDKYLPGHGMLVWHIDYNQDVWYNNSVNNTKSHNYVDLEEACGYYVDVDDYYSYSGYLDYDAYMEALAAYSFPGTKVVTEFTDDTTPSMKAWAGTGLGLPITNIAESNGVITFDVAGGRCDAEIPIVNAPLETGDDWFVASWNASEGATAYLLTVESYQDAVSKTETADFGSGSSVTLPEGWELIKTSASDVYTTNGNFGESSPSIKLSASDYGFMTREYESDITGLSFWLKGQSTDSKSCLYVEGSVNGQWMRIETVMPTLNSVSTVNISDFPSGVRQLRVIYSKSKGNVAIDDFAVTYGGSGFVALGGYKDLNVGNVTSYKVTGVPANAGSLSYKVCAVDASGHHSAYSESQPVDLGNAGIESVSVDAEACFSVNGREVTYHGAAYDRIEIFDLVGRVVGSAVADNDGVAVTDLPSHGTFILKTLKLCEKIMVK